MQRLKNYALKKLRCQKEDYFFKLNSAFLYTYLKLLVRETSKYYFPSHIPALFSAEFDATPLESSSSILLLFFFFFCSFWPHPLFILLKLKCSLFLVGFSVLSSQGEKQTVLGRFRFQTPASFVTQSRLPQRKLFHRTSQMGCAEHNVPLWLNIQHLYQKTS